MFWGEKNIQNVGKRGHKEAYKRLHSVWDLDEQGSTKQQESL